MDDPIPAEFPGFADELRAYWRRLPNKGMLFALLAAWMMLFQFLGNSSFGYIDTASLFRWMFNAYNATSVVADDGHGNLVPFLVLGLLWWKRKELVAKPMAAWGPGLFFIGLGLLFHMVGYVLQQPRASIVGLFTGLYGMLGLAWGRRWLQVSFFPFFLFAFMIPLGSLTEPLTFPLRLAITKTVAVICHDLLGLQVACQGTELFNSSVSMTGGGYKYDVAPACSGIKSLIAVGLASIVSAFVFFQTTGKRLIILAAALPLAILGNTLRLVTLVLVTEFFGRKAGDEFHESTPMNMVLYVPAFLGLILLIRWLERPVAKPPSTGPTLPGPAPA